MPNLEITYCIGCNWLLRAGWYAQECLSTFGTAISVTLIPDDTGGVFRISLDGTPIWDRKRDGGFPDIRTLKQRIRNLIEPDLSLGHLDR
ncbi:SelT/SelW/SelH family protein [Paracoccus methylarcula]|uniref:SelT/SelW/SelH family protein n=1 Tax=Paracoccus methylarcula TaxID=72022 RepID=A0A422R0S8_9RHOB|nr:SelT/SelW/SelH family protein [Paracoccus methylarcula]RNF35800.1 SelT/SelW/SelH family protein [Paracoccus methylarcula]